VAFLLAAVAILAAAPAALAADSAGDQVVIKGRIYVGPDESVDDVVIVDGDVMIDGIVNGDLVSVSAPVIISGSGTVHGDVIALADRVTVTTGGTVDGDIVYGDKKPQVQEETSVGGVRRLDANEITGPLGFFFSYIAFWLAVSISSLALGLVLLWLAPRAAERALQAARTQFGPAIAWGFGFLIGLPILGVLAIVTLVGIPLGVGLLLALVPLYAIGYVTGAWLLGRTLVKPPRGRALSFLAGWGILRLVALVPALGALAGVAAALFGLGALAAAAWSAREASPGAEAGAEA
jgi:hypothetical protein